MINTLVLHTIFLQNLIGSKAKYHYLNQGPYGWEMEQGKWEQGELLNVWFVPNGDQNLLSSGSALG